ncbi:MAG: hypothetical protein OEZ59_03465 [Deltaproteobacteria bacterium]|nr:hypothetical protein [Deltaproteobacteria bacterium]
MSETHLEFITRLFSEYDELALKLFRSVGAELKEDGSTVTELDKLASRMFMEAFSGQTPDFGIISEEEKDFIRTDAEWKWVIDPVDGTASFSRGYPIWGVGVGLLHDDEPCEGYLRFPALDETYAFCQDQLYINGQPAEFPQPSPVEDSRNILIDASAHKRIVDSSPFRDVKLRILGSNLYHMISLAMGRCEAMICGRVSLWDLASALPLTRASGMVESYLDGSSFRVSDLRPEDRYRLPKALVIAPRETMEEIQPRAAMSFSR